MKFFIVRQAWNVLGCITFHCISLFDVQIAALKNVYKYFLYYPPLYLASGRVRCFAAPPAGSARIGRVRRRGGKTQTAFGGPSPSVRPSVRPYRRSTV